MKAATLGVLTSLLMVSGPAVFADPSFVLTNGQTTNTDYISSRLGFTNFNVSVLVSDAGSKWTAGDTIFVGYSNGNSQITVSNGGYVTNLGQLILGAASTAPGNSILVTGAGSKFDTALDLCLGSGAGGNSIRISAGGVMNVVSGLCLSAGTNAPNNRLTVTDSGSAFNTAGVAMIGQYASGNQLMVSNGARFATSQSLNVGNTTGTTNNLALFTGSNTLATIGTTLFVFGTNQLVIADRATVSNNAAAVRPGATATVSGGAVWENGSQLIVGGDGSNALLDITTAGAVFTGNAYLGGFQNNGTNNSLIVNGSNSTLFVTSNLFVGSQGTGNRLLITNQGAVTIGDYLSGSTAASSLLFLGNNAAGGTNLIQVTGTNSRLLAYGAMLIGASGASGNRLEIFSGGLAESFDALIGNPSSSNNTVLVSDPGSTLDTANLYVGYASRSNQLIITNGAAVTNFNATVGRDNNSFSNRVIATDADTRWVVKTNLVIGAGINGNSATVTNGALLVSSSTIIGSNSFAHTNFVAVGGIGSVWSNAGAITIGQFGRGNQLVVNAGGRLDNSNATLGELSSSATNNAVLITDVGSTWTNRGLLTIGLAGGGNRLVVSNGGWVATAGATIGFSNSASANRAILDGAGSLWTNSGDLIVGYDGARSVLLATNGGRIESVSGYLGYGTNIFGGQNSAIVAGTNSQWNQRSNLIVGVFTSQNTLLISQGGVVTNRYVSIGDGSNAVLNIVTVNGTNSALRAGAEIDVGYNGYFSRLNVTNGGRVESETGVLGFGANSYGNVATISGTGSTWSNSGNFFEGWLGYGNFLTVSNGGSLYASNLDIGTTASSGGNVATVTGTNSRIVLQLIPAAGFFNIGRTGANNSIIIANAGAVTNRETDIGIAPGANGNSLVVTDTNSSWFVQNTLFLGGHGSGNSMLVSNGASVASQTGSIGYYSDGANNVAVVTGVNSSWSNSASLYVGAGGFNNLLLISNGGFVSSLATGYVGQAATSYGNSAIVTGFGSKWNIGTELDIGDLGSTNSLLISNGGQVVSPRTFVGFATNAMSNTVTVTGGSSYFNGTGPVTVGVNGAGNQFNLLNSGVANSTALVIGRNYSAVSNAVLVTGNGFWSVGGVLTAGGDGAFNRLTVSNGGVVLSGSGIIGSNSFGDLNSATVTGPNSWWSPAASLTVGLSGRTNTLVVSNGALVSSGYGYLGYNASAKQNWAIINGANSEWRTTNDLYVGASGPSNAMTVYGSGRATANTVTIGEGASASNNYVHISGPGSQLVASNFLAVGNGGARNALYLDDRAMATDVNGYVGFTSGNNYASVDGPGTRWFNSSSLYLGSAGANNALDVSRGAMVEARDLLLIGALPTSGANVLTVTAGSVAVTNSATNGLLEVRRGDFRLLSGQTLADKLVMTNPASTFYFDGGLLALQSATVSNGLPFVVGTGTNAAALKLGSGNFTFNNGLSLAANSRLSGTGTILGNVTNAGSFTPGASPGKVTINGDLRLRDTAGMTFEIGGLAQGANYDYVEVTNFVQFAGTLSLTLINGFTPGAGDTFNLMSFASRGGAFTNIASGARLATSGGIGSFLVNYSGTNLQLTAYQNADLDGDGIADSWALQHFGHTPLTPTEKTTDTDGDGASNYAEFLAGTNPTNAASVFRFTTTQSTANGAFVVRFTVAPGKFYRVYFSSTLSNFVEVPVPLFTQPAAGIYEWTDDGTQTGGMLAARFYKVSAE